MSWGQANSGVEGAGGAVSKNFIHPPTNRLPFQVLLCHGYVMRNSGYRRIDGDVYITPRWVYEALYTVEPWAKGAWDCAPVNPLADFLSTDNELPPIATNPPYKLAVEFCRHAIQRSPKVAMLLSIHFDAAKRRDLFADCPMFKAKYTLTKRIRWENLEQKSSPSENHAWYVWERGHSGRPTLGWLP